MCICMSVMVAHGEEEGKDGAHHQGHQLRLGEPSFAISAVRVTVAYICHLRKYMDGGDVEEGASTEQHGGARAGEGVQVALYGQDKDDFEFYSLFQHSCF